MNYARTFLSAVKPAGWLWVSLLLTANGTLSANVLPPPSYQVQDDNHINMATGQVAPSLTDLAIGGARGLTHSISADGGHFVNYTTDHGSHWGPRDSFHAGLKLVELPRESQNQTPLTDVTLPSEQSRWSLVAYWGNQSTSFYINGDGDYVDGNGTYSPISDTGASLEYRTDLSQFVFTMSDGTQVYYQSSGDLGSQGGIIEPTVHRPPDIAIVIVLFPPEYFHLRAEKIIKPNGMTYDFAYNQHGKLSNVRVNTGFQLKYTYDIQSTGLAPELEAERQRIMEARNSSTFYQVVNHAAWTSNIPASVIGVNNQFESCDDNSLTCSPTQDWPSTRYTWSHGGMPAAASLADTQFTVTDAAGLDTVYYHERFDMGGNHLTDIPSNIRYEPRIAAIKPANARAPVYEYVYENRGVLYSDYHSMWGRWQTTGVGVLKRATRMGTAYGYSPANSYFSDTINGGPGREIDSVKVSNSGRMYKIEARHYSVSLDNDRYNRVSAFKRKGMPADTYSYDARGNITKITTTGKNGATSYVEAEYPDTCTNIKTCNQPEWTSDAKGNRTHYTYHPESGQIETITYPANEHGIKPGIRYEYSQQSAHYYHPDGTKSDGSPIWLKSAEFTCIKTAMTDDGCAGGAADEVVTRFEYEHDNLLMTGKTVTAANDQGAVVTLRTCYGYDQYGHRIYEVSPKADLPNCENLAEPMPYMTVTRFDKAGRVLAVMQPDPDGSDPRTYLAVRNTYNSQGLLEKVERGELASWNDQTISPADWSGFSVHTIKAYRYDDYGRKEVSATLDPATEQAVNLTQINYDAESRIKCKTVRMNPGRYGRFPFSGLPAACALGVEGSEGPDRITKYTYDNRDNLTVEERAYGTALSQAYVTNTYVPFTQLLESQTDANGNKTELRYDDFMRLKRRVYPSKSTPGQLAEWDYTQYTYDANNNLRTERKRSGNVITHYYDSLNRLIIKDLDDNTHSQDVYYDYDLRGLMLHARFVSDAGRGITSAFDGFGNLIRSTNTMGGVSRSLNYRYDDHGNRTRITHPDNWFFAYGYDGLDRINAVRESASASVSANTNSLLTLTYAPHGKRYQINRTGGTTTTYHRDHALRLDSFEQDFAGTGNDLTNQFDYNPANQITLLTQSNTQYTYSGNQQLTGTYVANGLNQYTSIAGQSVGYDRNGNLTNDGVYTYTYDLENRLVRASGAGVTAELSYDPLGRLFETSVTPDNGSTTKTQFLHDGDALVAEYDGTATTPSRRYVHGDQVDEPWLQYNGAQVGAAYRRFLHADHQGSIIAHSSNSGAVLNRLAYDAYGIPGASNIDRFGYTGQLWLKELGLFHYKARMYSPKLGRFLQTDPVGYEDQMNLYTYVHNDPLNYTDPTGKVAQVCAIPTGPMQACAAAATKVGGWIAAAIGAIWVASEATDDSSDLPEDLVGVQDDKAGRQGNRHNSGPLSPEHGGTGDAESDFDVLNPSGNSEETDDGTRVGESGVRLRPGTDKKGPRIDVPASGDKPHETLHYPPKEKEPK